MLNKQSPAEQSGSPREENFRLVGAAESRRKLAYFSRKIETNCRNGKGGSGAMSCFVPAMMS